MICRVCDATKLEKVIDLGLQPWCNHFLKKEEVGREPFYPLNVVYCLECSTAQLDFTVAKEVMFGDHTYLSGVTKSLDEHFRKTAVSVDQAFFKSRSQKSVLDIGSNDGTQLKHFQALGYDVLGVESSVTTAQMAVKNGVPTINEFFNLELAEKLGRQFQVINASGVFFHLEELHSVTAGIKKCLADDGVFVVQFLYMKKIIENCAFDQIYHEHLLYYTLRTVEKLLNRHGLRMFDARLEAIHGGSIVGYITHAETAGPTERLETMLREEDQSGVNQISTYLEFAQRIREMKERNLAFLNKAKAEGKTVYGMGAPVKGNTLLNYFGVSTDLIPRLLEKNPLRDGLFAPGSHIPVAMEASLAEPPDIYYVLAWNFKREILANNQALINQGVEFYFPVNDGSVA